MAGRTDADLQEIIDRSTITFDKHVFESNAELFSEWNDSPDRFRLAMDVNNVHVRRHGGGPDYR